MTTVRASTASRQTRAPGDTLVDWTASWIGRTGHKEGERPTVSDWTAPTQEEGLTTSPQKSSSAAIINTRRRAMSEAGKPERPSSPAVRVQGMRKWHGRVVDREDEFFTAELVPDHPGPTVLADFEVGQLGEPDVSVGDVVYFTVRMVLSPSGYPTRTSAIRLRRLGLWTQEQVDRIQAEAAADFEDFSQFVE